MFFRILLWMLTSLVIWNLNITVSTTLEYCYRYALNRKLKLMGWAKKYFVKEILGHFEKFVKTSGLPSCILNVRSLTPKYLNSHPEYFDFNIQGVQWNKSLKSSQNEIHFLPIKSCIMYAFNCLVWWDLRLVVKFGSNVTLKF